jgi:hypothetical protein
VGLLESREAGLPPAARPYPTEYVYVIVEKSSGKVFSDMMFRSRKAAKAELAISFDDEREIKRDYAVRRARLTILHR